MKNKWVVIAVAVAAFVVIAPVVFMGALVLLMFMSDDGPRGGDYIDACTQIDETMVSLDDGQIHVVTAIVDVATELGLDNDAKAIAITTALAESKARIYANDGTHQYRPGTQHENVMSYAAWVDAAAVVKGSLAFPHDQVGRDWDSVGPFQQRPSAGWGTVEQLMDPVYQAQAFFGGPGGPNQGSPRGLLDIPGWKDLTIAEAAQRVQGSLYPDAYMQYTAQAKNILAAVDTSVCDEGSNPDLITAEGWMHPVPTSSGLSSRFGEQRGGYVHAGDDIPSPSGTPIYAAADGVVVDSHCQFKNGRSPCQVRVDHGGGIETLYVHMYPSGVHAHKGDRVQAGQHIADIGSNGNSTGAHLHLEVWRNGTPINPYQFFLEQGIALDRP